MPYPPGVGEIPADSPAMAALDERGQKFVQLYVDGGWRSVSRCYTEAGFSNKSASNASHYVRRPQIVAAIKEVCASRNASALPAHYYEIQAISQDRKHPKQLEALLVLMGFAGVILPKAPQALKVEITHSIESLRQRARQLLLEDPYLIEHKPEEPLAIEVEVAADADAS